MPCPTDQQVFWNGPNSAIVGSTDPTADKPIAVTVGNEDGDITLQAAFDCSVNVSLSAIAPMIDPEDIFFVDLDYNVKRLSEEAVSEGERTKRTALSGASKNGDEGTGSGHDGRKFKNRSFFRSNVFEVNEDLKAELPPGVYLLTFGVTPSGSDGQSSYHWVVYFIVP